MSIDKESLIEYQTEELTSITERVFGSRGVSVKLIPAYKGELEFDRVIEFGPFGEVSNSTLVWVMEQTASEFTTETRNSLELIQIADPITPVFVSRRYIPVPAYG
ncbi:hypothetical protein IH981_04480, partial [Patescibacteria group bacterium]|nr:hypothetical protein [Patescibacteria group bacterium]